MSDDDNDDNKNSVIVPVVSSEDKSCTEDGRFTVGTCPASEVVHWQHADDDATARELFDRAKAAGDVSVVLFRQDGKPMMFSSIHHLDVACIIQAYKQESTQNIRWTEEEDHTETPETARRKTTTTVVDRVLVELAVETGEAVSLPPSRSALKQWSLKKCMDALFWRESVEFFSAGPHRYASRCFWDARRHPAVRGHVALTLDDAPCRFEDRENHSRMSEILDVLRDYDAFATFMVVGKFIGWTGEVGHRQRHEGDLIRLLKEGHELGNHGMVDKRYDTETRRGFASAVDECNELIRSLHCKAGLPEKPVEYFRAPHGRYTKDMETVLRERGMVNVMCDTYGSCPIVQDGNYIGTVLSQRAQDGSIILLHTPERGFRDWCMVALRRLLEGLRQRRMSVVTVGMLQTLAGEEDHGASTDPDGNSNRGYLEEKFLEQAKRLRNNITMQS